MIRERLNLTRPLDGWLGDFAVRLREVTKQGARIDSDEPIPPESRALLRFWWNGEELEVMAEMTSEDRLFFVEAPERLWQLIDESVAELRRAQYANALGERDDNIISGDQTLTAASAGARIAGYVTWTLADGHWKHRSSLIPDQPEDGFTVSAAEDEEQVAMLCQTYENGDEEARKMTRMLAQLSVG